MILQSDRWRLALFAALGVLPSGCGGKTDSDVGPSACGESIPANQSPNGMTTCSSGLVHRPSASIECSSMLPRGTELQVLEGVDVECTKDADCTERPHGYCGASGPLGGSPAPAACIYGCVTDADCAEGSLCECGNPVGRCVTSNCRQDADCGDGSLCARWDATRTPGCGHSYSYQCQKPEDECAVDSDCPSGEHGGKCVNEGTNHVCIALDGSVCGRPFLVEGSARLAALTNVSFVNRHRSAESVGRASNDGMVECEVAWELQELVGGHWAAIGLMEHASIAAFARFALQLMHLGAPLELLEAAQRAMFDETEHAKLCFDLASQILGRPVGPGKLSLHDALTDTSLAEIVRLTIREGCIGETVAAMEAFEGATAAVEPRIASMLQRIQQDELRHAELAWRFVQWALSQDESEVTPASIGSRASSIREVVAGEFASALAELDAPLAARTISRTESACAGFGVLPEATRQHVRRLALRDVIAPCVSELLRGEERERGGSEAPGSVRRWAHPRTSSMYCGMS